MKTTEAFLFQLETNEKIVFEQHLDDFIVPLFPFFQLVHVLNLTEILNQLLAFEQDTGGRLVRAEGNVALSISEEAMEQQQDEIRRRIIQLLTTMRF